MQAKPASFVRSLFVGQLQSETILPFPWPDAETEETTDAVVHMTEEWADEAIDPVAIDEEKRIPQGVLDGLAELGLFGLTIPEEYDGAGCGQWTYVKLMEAVSRRCASTVTVLGAHLGLGSKGLLLAGSDEQKRTWLPKLASGELIGAFALTEADAGSDAGALRTTADALPDGRWKLNGRKIWITNGGFASYFAVFARTPHPDDPDAPLLKRPISAFLVPRDTPGLSTGVPENKLGLRGSSTTDVGLEDVIVPADHLIGEPGAGFKIALNTLNAGRHGLAACCIGQAKLARELAVAHTLEREQFGGPIARLGMVREMIAGMDADIYAMEAGTWLTAGMVDAGKHETMLEAACCKMFATERLWTLCNDALQLTGGTGFMREYPYERILRDARINLIFEGTNQVLRMMLAVQGTRPLLAGEVPVAQARSFDGAHPELRSEGEQVAVFALALAREARAAVGRAGKAFRGAQHEQKRLSDMAVNLFTMGAILSRASTPSADRPNAAEEPELDLARLAFKRCAAAFQHAEREAAYADDALIERVAARRTGI